MSIENRVERLENKADDTMKVVVSLATISERLVNVLVRMDKHENEQIKQGEALATLKASVQTNSFITSGVEKLKWLGVATAFSLIGYYFKAMI